MGNKINVSKLLKDCPSGMELDCTMYEDVCFDYVDELNIIHCYIQHGTHKTSLTFNQHGTPNSDIKSKCVIFPKGKTTWGRFQKPFKDGDILFSGLGDCDNPFIFKQINGWGNAQCYCAINRYKEIILNSDNWTPIKWCRLATEEEKEKLFKVIKDNGYKWNEETKTLDKLEDTEDKGNISDGYHTFNELYEYRLLYNASMFNELAKQGLYDVHKSKLHSDGTVPFGDENWFIVQAELPTGQISNHYEMKDWELFKVPEKEKANPYDGHTPQDVAKRLRDFLTLEKLIKPKFKVGDKIQCMDYEVKITEVNIEDECYEYESKFAKGIGSIAFSEQDNWELVPDVKPKFKVGDAIQHKENTGWVCTITRVADRYYVDGHPTCYSIPFDKQDEYELVPNKFDITTLKHFESKVLVRNYKSDYWKPAIFGFIEKGINTIFCVEGGNFFNMCIPYEGNEHLIGTTNDCDEYFKNW